MRHSENYNPIFSAHKHQPKRLMLVALRMGSIMLIALGAVMFFRYCQSENKAYLEQQNAAAQNKESTTAARSITAPTGLQPSAIEIPDLNIKAPIVLLGLTADGGLQVPENYNEAGWYKFSPAPGQTGAAVVVGHLDSPSGPSIFWNLKKLVPGQEINITKNNGEISVFKVDSLEEYSQDNFPTEKVYGDLSYPGLRLITCSGTYDYNKHHYTKNLVIFASIK